MTTKINSAFVLAQELLSLAHERSVANPDRELLLWVDAEIAALPVTLVDEVLVAQ